MVGVTLNNNRYIMVCNKQILKLKSLEDNLYFTIREIFFNIEPEFKINKANYINSKLSNGIPYEDRNDKFEYYKLTNDSNFVISILDFLNSIKQSDFTFPYDNSEHELELDIETLNSEFICFDLWWNQLEELKQLLFNLKIKKD